MLVTEPSQSLASSRPCQERSLCYSTQNRGENPLLPTRVAPRLCCVSAVHDIKNKLVQHLPETQCQSQRAAGGVGHQEEAERGWCSFQGRGCISAPLRWGLGLGMGAPLTPAAALQSSGTPFRLVGVLLHFQEFCKLVIQLYAGNLHRSRSRCESPRFGALEVTDKRGPLESRNSEWHAPCVSDH